MTTKRCIINENNVVLYSTIPVFRPDYIQRELISFVFTARLCRGASEKGGAAARRTEPEHEKQNEKRRKQTNEKHLFFAPWKTHCTFDVCPNLSLSMRWGVQATLRYDSLPSGAPGGLRIESMSSGGRYFGRTSRTLCRDLAMSHTTRGPGTSSGKPQ